MQFKILVQMCFAVAIISVTACGGSSPKATPISAATATTNPSTAGPLTYPDSTRVNIGVVDAAIAAAVGGNADALLKVIQFQTVPCATNPTGAVPIPPKCTPAEAPGTPVQRVLIYYGGHESDGRAQGAVPPLLETLQNWLGPSRHLYAVKQLTRPDPLTGAKYAVVFVTSTGQANTLGLSDSGIVWIYFDTSQDPRKQADDPPGQFVLPPLK
jgi:hypothetical protein